MALDGNTPGTGTAGPAPGARGHGRHALLRVLLLQLLAAHVTALRERHVPESRQPMRQQVST